MKIGRKTLRSMRNSIFVGMALTVPIIVTVFILNAVINITTSWVLKSDFFEAYRKGWTGLQLRLVTLAAIIAVLYFIGLLARNVLGRRLYRAGDHLLGRIPFIKGIYISIRQISASLFTQRKTLFKEVVLLEYPRKGLFCMAFVTAPAPEGFHALMGDDCRARDCVSLFIPTTPNPTSGYLILARRRELISLDMPVSDALTFIMSGGAVAPGQNGGETGFTLLDRLESSIAEEDATQEAATHGRDSRG